MTPHSICIINQSIKKSVSSHGLVLVGVKTAGHGWGQGVVNYAATRLSVLMSHHFFPLADLLGVAWFNKQSFCFVLLSSRLLMWTLKDYIKSLSSVYLQERRVPKWFRLCNQAVHEPIWLYDTLSFIVLLSIPLRGHNRRFDHHLCGGFVSQGQ